MDAKTERLFEKILTPILENYFDVVSTESLVKRIKTKERIGTVRNMQIIIFSNDHTPPHFHVKSKDKKIDVKFKIENCEFISGKIDGKNLKRLKGFYNDMKTQIVKDKMMEIWNKKTNE